MKRNYDECVTKYSDSFVRVVLDPGYVSRIQNFVTELVEAKAKEDHHKIDSNKEVKRFTTGFLGEMLESGQKFDKIKDVTTFFEKSYDRQKVIEQNKKNAVRHAYFREYLALQRLAYMFRFDARNGDLKEA